MADKNEAAPSGIDAFFNGLIKFLEEHWPEILVFGIIYLTWRFEAWKGVLGTAGTIILGWVAWKLWVHYIQQDFISGIDFVLLEVIPPRDVVRSPKAMELFITNALYHWSYKGGKEEYWQGAVWFWFSLEIASIDGQVHFYIRTPTRIRGLIETQMYAQYPQAQVRAVEDYTLAVDEISPESEWMGWGCDWRLLKPEAYPLKTYVDFGLDKDPKEEYKVDPITPVIELFGSLKKGEQMWAQIVIRPSKVRYKVPGKLFTYQWWDEEARDEMLRFLKPFTQYKKQPDHPDAQPWAMEIRMPDMFKNVATAMAAKTGKIGFDTGIRTMYIAKKEIFDMSNRRNLRLIWRQYARPDCNGIVRNNSTQADAYGGIFTIGPKTIMLLANRMLHEFQHRAFFHVPLRHELFNTHTLKWPLSLLFRAYQHAPTFVLNVEELATLWHFPGQILRVPTLERIESREASPPPNLPT